MVNRKKVGTIILTGLFLLGGAVMPGTILASPPPGQNNARVSEAYFEQALDLGVNKEEAAKYLNPEINPRELLHAAAIANVSGKPFAEVLAMRNLANTWQDVEATLGITKEQLRTFHQKMMAEQMEEDFAIPKQMAFDLLVQKYDLHDILAANTLAKAANKTVVDVLAMKKINNFWKDVAQELGVDKDVLNLTINPGRAYAGPSDSPGIR